MPDADGRTVSVERSLRLMGYPEEYIARSRNAPHAPHARLERVGRVLADFDALPRRRQRVVSVLDLVESFRAAFEGRARDDAVP